MDLKEILWEGVNWILLAQESNKCPSSCWHGDGYLGSIRYSGRGNLLRLDIGNLAAIQFVLLSHS